MGDHRPSSPPPTPTTRAARSACRGRTRSTTTRGASTCGCAARAPRWRRRAGTTPWRPPTRSARDRMRGARRARCEIAMSVEGVGCEIHARRGVATQSWCGVRVVPSSECGAGAQRTQRQRRRGDLHTPAMAVAVVLELRSVLMCSICALFLIGNRFPRMLFLFIALCRRTSHAAPPPRRPPSRNKLKMPVSWRKSRLGLSGDFGLFIEVLLYAAKDPPTKQICVHNLRCTLHRAPVGPPGTSGSWLAGHFLWVLVQGFGLDGRLLLARRGRVYV